MPVNCQNCLYLYGEHASDLAELFAVPVIWQNCLSMDSVPVIWQNRLYVEEHASDLTELVVPVIWQNCLYKEKHASELPELPVPMWRSVQMIWQNWLCQ
jgi:hypothetical protein